MIGFFLSYYMAIRNYRPVQNLMKLIEDKVPSEEASKNEFFGWKTRWEQYWTDVKIWIYRLKNKGLY